MPCSVSSRVRVSTTSTCAGGVSVVVAVGSSTRLDHPPAVHAVEQFPGGPADRRQPLAHPVRARGDVLADRHDQAHPPGHVRLAGLERPHRRHALGLREDRGELRGDGRADAQHPDAARAGQPLARGAVDDVGAQVGVGVAQRLGGVQHQRHPGLPAERRELGRRLEQAAVARDVGQVHEGRRVVGEQPRAPPRRPPGPARRPAAAPGAGRRRAAGRCSARTRRAGRPRASRPAAASR